MAEEEWTKGDARGFLLPSFRRALADTITLHWFRTLMTAATAVAAALIAFLATGNRASWWAVLGGPAVLVGAAVVLFFMNLSGWNRRCRSRWSFNSAGPRLNLHLQPKDRTLRYDAPETDCWVRSPDGITLKHRPGGRAFHGEFYANYPDDFVEAPALTAGRYRVTWVEKAEPATWREMLTHRLTVTDAMLLQPASQPMQEL